MKPDDWPILFSVLFFFSGLAIIVAGSYVVDVIDYHISFFHDTFDTIAIISIIVGIIILFIGYLGTIASVRADILMLKTFSVLVTVMFFTELAMGAGVFAYHVYRKNRGNAFEIENAFLKMENDKEAENFVYWAQWKLECCGLNGTASYRYRISGLPKSCCPDNHSHDENDEARFQQQAEQNCTMSNAFKEGCGAKFGSLFVKLLFVIGAFSLVLCLLDIFVLLSVHYYLEHMTSIARIKVHLGVSKAIKTSLAAVPIKSIARGSTDILNTQETSNAEAEEFLSYDTRM